MERNQVDIKELVTVRSASKLTDWSISWINQLIYKGKLELVEIDGVRFVRRPQVEQVKQESRTPVAA